MVVTMCYGCYEEYGAPTTASEAARRAAALVNRVYDFSMVGGNLHIVLDDWNIEDSNLDYCDGVLRNLEAGKPDQWTDINPDQNAAERECLNALRALSEKERAAALAVHSGFIA